MSEKFLLIDGYSILNRAFYGVPDMTSSEGMHTGAIYGFLNILFKVLKEENPEYLAVVFSKEKSTFCLEKSSQSRETPSTMPEELKEQMSLLEEIMGKMGISMVSWNGFEEKDVLGTLALKSEEKGLDVRILTGNQDFLQLAREKIWDQASENCQGAGWYRGLSRSTAGERV